MRIFITGANGQLAKSFIESSPDAKIHLASKKDLDVTNGQQISEQLEAFEPDIVFHFASMTRGDECAKDPEKAFKINVEGTENIVAACKKLNSSLLFVSTNEVFNGKKKTPYNEDDTPDPITVVGKTKLKAEDIIRENLEKYFIIRTSWLYSNWSSNFIHVIIDRAKKNKKLTLVEDEVSSPTSSLDLAKALEKLISTKKYGVYHLANEGIVSRLDFGKKILELYGLDDIDITSVTLDQFDRLSKPPLYSALKSKKAKKLGIKMTKWDDALERFLAGNNISLYA